MLQGQEFCGIFNLFSVSLERFNKNRQAKVGNQSRKPVADFFVEKNESAKIGSRLPILCLRKQINRKIDSLNGYLVGKGVPQFFQRIQLPISDFRFVFFEPL